MVRGMKTSLLFAAVIAVAAVGCKKKDSAATSTGSVDCKAAIDKSMALSKTEMEKQPGGDPAMLQQLADLGMKKCTEDKWSPDAIKCMVDATRMAESQACYNKLTKEQQESMNKAAMELVMGSGAGAAPAAAQPTEPAGSGSAM